MKKKAPQHILGITSMVDTDFLFYLRRTVAPDGRAVAGVEGGCSSAPTLWTTHMTSSAVHRGPKSRGPHDPDERGAAYQTSPGPPLWSGPAAGGNGGETGRGLNARRDILPTSL